MLGIKCVVVGDSCVEKTKLLIAYTSLSSSGEFVSTVFDNHYALLLLIDGEEYMLTLSDTSGQENYAPMRPLSYPKTDVFVVCFSVVNPSSFENISEKWIPEIRKFCPNVPIILVGTDVDLRENAKTIQELKKENLKPINPAQGLKLAKKIKAVKYLECSDSNQEGIKIIFDEAVRAAALGNSKKGKPHDRQKSLEVAHTPLEETKKDRLDHFFQYCAENCRRLPLNDQNSIINKVQEIMFEFSQEQDTIRE